ncbi:hypothetical protein GCM10027592_07150 [Spirosoma flavus]
MAILMEMVINFVLIRHLPLSKVSGPSTDPQQLPFIYEARFPEPYFSSLFFPGGFVVNEFDQLGANDYYSMEF